MTGIGKRGAAQIVQHMVERWPSPKWDEGTLTPDWIEWISTLNIESEQADNCLRECKRQGLNPYYDRDIPKVLERLKDCQPKPAREEVNTETGEVWLSLPAVARERGHTGTDAEVVRGYFADQIQTVLGFRDTRVTINPALKAPDETWGKFLDRMDADGRLMHTAPVRDRKGIWGTLNMVFGFARREMVAVGATHDEVDEWVRDQNEMIDSELEMRRAEDPERRRTAAEVGRELHWRDALKGAGSDR